MYVKVFLVCSVEAGIRCVRPKHVLNGKCEPWMLMKHQIYWIYTNEYEIGVRVEDIAKRFILAFCRTWRNDRLCEYIEDRDDIKNFLIYNMSS